MNGKMRILAALTAVCLLAAVPVVRAEEPAAGTAPAATAAPGGVLAYGAKGDAVKQLQARLLELGYDAGTPDGIFGRGTQNAVRAFQRRNGLTADGQAGPLTLEKLYSGDAVPAPEAPEPTDVLAGELPMLVNKEHRVDEYFVPADLVLLSDVADSKLVTIKYKGIMVVREAADALVRMLEAAKADGVTKWQISAGYRSWDDQTRTLDNKTSSYMNKNSGWSRARARNAALRTVAEPGCSEHHLGLALDINVPGSGSFKGTKQQKWLHAHCWEYGFIIRYPKGKEDITGFTAEPWHIRYVGVEHAMMMRDLDMCLEEYLDAIEAGTVQPPQKETAEEIILPDDETTEGDNPE